MVLRVYSTSLFEDASESVPWTFWTVPQKVRAGIHGEVYAAAVTIVEVICCGYILLFTVLWFSFRNYRFAWCYVLTPCVFVIWRRLMCSYRASILEHNAFLADCTVGTVPGCVVVVLVCRVVRSLWSLLGGLKEDLKWKVSKRFKTYDVNTHEARWVCGLYLAKCLRRIR